MNWLSRLRQATVGNLVARKSYEQAIERLRAELAERRSDPRLRMRLADVLLDAGRGKEAVALLEPLADEFALSGYAARAIVLLKRIQAVEPRRDVAEKLACLIAQQQEPAPDPWRFGRTSRQSSPGLEIGMEEIPDEIGMESEEDAARAAPLDAPVRAEATPGTEATDGGTHAVSGRQVREPSLPFGDDAVRDELLALIEEVLRPDPQAGPPAVPLPGAGSPLFRSFSETELAQVIDGLRLSTHEPGGIVVTQGEAGDSLFVVASGRLWAYLKDSRGRSVPVRELAEGDFFGEIALLTGRPRSATIVAAARSELLELDRTTLDAVAEGHPHVKQVLQDFYAQRASYTVEAAIAARDHRA